MNALHVLRRPRVAAFAAAAVAIYGVAIGLLASLPRLKHPDVVSAALLVDLTVVVPLLYALLIRRRGSWAGVVPVFLLSLIGAGLVLPASSRAALPLLRWFALPAELATVALVVWRIRRGLNRFKAEDDILARLERAFGAAVRNPRLAQMLAYEMSVFYYALFSWRDRPVAEPGRTFSYHRAGSYGAIVFALMMVSACEIVGVHVVVSRASSAAAWLLTALGLYGVVWILGDYQAMRLRPLRVEGDVLVVRLGLRWSVTVPRQAIAAVAPAPRPPWARRAPGHLHAALLTPPQWQITLREALVARGPYGLTKRITTVALAADDRAGLRQALVACELLSGPAPDQSLATGDASSREEAQRAARNE